MSRRLRGWWVALATVLVAAQVSAPARAQDMSLLYRLLGTEAENRCWSRMYDAEHLKQRPRQRVVEIRIDSLPWSGASERGVPKGASALERYRSVKASWIDIRLRNPAGRASKGVDCSLAADNRRLVCGLESDGGTIELAPLADGRVCVTAGARMQVETERGFVDLAKSDDRVFDLRPLPPSQCRVPGG